MKFQALIKKALPCVAAIAVFSSCGGGQQAANDNGLVTVDIAADYPKDKIRLQDIADVEYVPLAMSDEVLLNSNDRLFHLSDRYIMVYGRDNIFVFNRAGEIVSHFNRRGRGPGEYASIGDIVFDEAADEIFVADIPEKIEVYTTTGQHRRTITLPAKSAFRLYDFDGEALLVCDDGRMPATNGKANPTPFQLVSKTDGTIVETLPITMPERYSTTAFRQLTGGDGVTRNMPVLMITTNNRLGSSNFTLTDISSDTVYTYTRERALTPAFVRKPSVHASEPRVVWGMELVTDSFVVFEVQTLDFDSALAGSYPPIRSLKYDYGTGSVTNIEFTDDNNPSAQYSNYGYDRTDAPANTAVRMLDPLKLKETHEKGELKGPLAEIAVNMKEDDNPVVMIVKFK